jgi:hypothetical protein
MFQASLCPSSGLLVGRQCLPTNKPTTTGSTSTSAFKRKPEAAAAILKELLMMGIIMPETC